MSRIIDNLKWRYKYLTASPVEWLVINKAAYCEICGESVDYPDEPRPYEYSTRTGKASRWAIHGRCRSGHTMTSITSDIGRHVGSISGY